RAVLIVFFIAIFVENLGVAPYTRVLRDMYSERGRGMAMSYVRAWSGGCQIIGSFLGGAMLDRNYGWLVFALAGICGAISSWNFRRIFAGRESPLFVAQAMGVREVTSSLRASEGFFWMNLTIMLFGLGNLMVLGVLPTLLVNRFNISNFALGNLNALTFIVTVFSYLLLARYVSNYGAKNGLLLGMTAGVLNPWLFLLSPSVHYLTVPYAFSGLMYAAFDISWMLLIISYVPTDQIGRHAAVYTFLMGIRGVTAMLATNLALPYVDPALLLSIGGIFTALGLGIGVWKRSRW
ncbi:MAG TPA: MFS transporter, partial [Candidatus Ozemobacteraceae bacterium]|nr:MFS transporter [Candidatus Ozemobacteraceae bacterium]